MVQEAVQYLLLPLGPLVQHPVVQPVVVAAYQVVEQYDVLLYVLRRHQFQQLVAYCRGPLEGQPLDYTIVHRRTLGYVAVQPRFESVCNGQMSIIGSGCRRVD